MHFAKIGGLQKLAKTAISIPFRSLDTIFRIFRSILHKKSCEKRDIPTPVPTPVPTPMGTSPGMPGSHLPHRGVVDDQFELHIM